MQIKFSMSCKTVAQKNRKIEKNFNTLKHKKNGKEKQFVFIFQFYSINLSILQVSILI